MKKCQSLSLYGVERVFQHTLSHVMHVLHFLALMSPASRPSFKYLFIYVTQHLHHSNFLQLFSSVYCNDMQLSVIVPNDLTVVSNMPLEKEESVTCTLQDKYQNYKHPIDEDSIEVTLASPLPPKKKVTFQMTPLTSTYLNVFVASYFDWLEKLVKVTYSYPFQNICFSLKF
jgi:hypothetical protein